VAVVRPALFALCVMVTAGVACSGEDSAATATSSTAAPASPATSVPDATSASTIAAVDPFAIPAVIDAAYVDRVLAALHTLVGNALRDVLASRRVEISAYNSLAQVYNSPQLEVEVQSLSDVLTDDPALYRQPPGDRRVAVQSVALATPSCIVVIVESDFSDVAVSPPPRDPALIGMVALVPASAAVRAKGENPTPWSIALARYLRPDEQVLEAAPCP